MKSKLETDEIAVVVIAEAKKDKADVVFEGIKNFASTVRAIPGCLNCEVYKEKNSDTHFVCTHAWKNAEAFGAFQHSGMLRQFQEKMFPDLISINIRELTQA